VQITEFTGDSLRFLDALPSRLPAEGFIWVFMDRDAFSASLPVLQQAAAQLGGSTLLDLHSQDLANPAHPSNYDYTSVYDLIIFRRLATQLETRTDSGQEAIIGAYNGHSLAGNAVKDLPAFNRITSRAVGFAVFDRFLISVHPPGCYAAKSFIQRFLADAQFSVGAAAAADQASARSRLPVSPADLVLRMINAMVDSYLDLRKELTTELGQWQTQLLKPNAQFTNWGALMTARSQLHVLEDLCDEQHDAMQEWLDSLHEQPLSSFVKNANHLQVLPSANLLLSEPLRDAARLEPDAQRAAQAQRDQLVARARDVIEHIDRVVHHARRLEQSAETVVQIHFSAQSNRTNDIMRTLTALTAVFLPLNLITGFFGMNFEFLPLIHKLWGFWVTFGFMLLIVVVVMTVFLRKRYIARTGL